MFWLTPSVMPACSQSFTISTASPWCIPSGF
jgi:hypothetical protein